MKRQNLLSKAEMRKVTGGYLQVSGCIDDSECRGGQWCCPNMSDPSQPWSCQTPERHTLPVTEGEVVMCPL